MSLCRKHAIAAAGWYVLQGIEFTSMNDGLKPFANWSECDFPACRLNGGWKIAARDPRDGFSAIGRTQRLLVAVRARVYEWSVQHRFLMVVVIDTVSQQPLRPRHPEKAHRPDAPSPPRPDWIRVRAPNTRGYADTRKIVRDNGLVTVCEEARLPQHRRVLVSSTRPS